MIVPWFSTSLVSMYLLSAPVMVIELVFDNVLPPSMAPPVHWNIPPES